MVIEQFHGLDILRVESRAEADRLEAAFAAAYCRIFSGDPYFEAFTLDEATTIWRRLTRTRHHITLVATEPAGPGEDVHVVGFGVAIPLSEAPDAARELTGMVPLKHTMYLVELGVDEAWRGRKLARHLVKLRIQYIDRDQYSHVVLRVAEGRTASFEMYRSMDFSDTGVSMIVQHRRTDGTVRGDTRYFMSRVLSQVRVDG